MPPSRTVARALICVSALLPLGLASCSSTSESGSAPSAASTGTGDGFPVDVTNAFGKASIPSRPTRILAASDADMNVAYALGLKPVAVPHSSVEDVSPAAAAAQKALGITDQKTVDDTDGNLSIEGVAAANPDLILATAVWELDRKTYDQLSAIAPVVAMPPGKGDTTTLAWDERTRRIAQAAGVPQKGEEAIQAVNTKFAGVAAAHPEYRGKTFSYVGVKTTELTFQSAADSDMSLMERLGFKRNAAAKKYASNGKTAVSPENLRDLDADIILAAFPYDKGDAPATILTDNPIWKGLPAVKAHRWIELSTDNKTGNLAATLAYPDTLQYPWLLEQMPPLLDKALAGRGGRTAG